MPNINTLLILDILLYFALILCSHPLALRPIKSQFVRSLILETKIKAKYAPFLSLHHTLLISGLQCLFSIYFLFNSLFHSLLLSLPLIPILSDLISPLLFAYSSDSHFSPSTYYQPFIDIFSLSLFILLHFLSHRKYEELALRASSFFFPQSEDSFSIVLTFEFIFWSCRNNLMSSIEFRINFRSEIKILHPKEEGEYRLSTLFYDCTLYILFYIAPF